MGTCIKVAALAASVLAATVSGTEASFANDDQVLAEYSGQYTCIQGATALRLRVFGDFSKPTHKAIFQFGPTSTNRTIPTGSFVLEGTFQTNGGVIDLHPIGWISQPYGYTMVGLTGRSDDAGDTFLGSVINGTGCSNFAVHRSFLAVGVPPVAAHIPSADGRSTSRAQQRSSVHGDRSGQSEVSLRQQGGTFVVPVLLNNTLTLDFVIDSGAADVNVPADVVMTLYRTGTIRDGDFLGSRTYQLADGSVVPSPTFRIRSLKVGDRELRDVVASISNVKGSLLLGQSFLNQFKSWSVDNSRRVLVLD
jgi:predicted aspartyl protease